MKILKNKTENQIITTFCRAILNLINNKNKYLKFEENTQSRANKFTWQEKINLVYKDIHINLMLNLKC